MTEDRTRARNSEDVQGAPRPPREERHTEAGLVSVVIPCYNQAHYLAESIESVLAQSYPNFEVVVVDDGSTDDTSEVAGRYPKVRCIRQENQGLSAARNTGLDRSRGEYVVFLDADDRLLSEALETGVGQLEVHPECAFVSGHIARIGADGSSLGTPRKKSNVEDHYSKLLRYNHIWTPAVVTFRRLVFGSAGVFDTSIDPTADWDLYLRIAREFPVHHHGEMVAEYRQHGANMTGNSALMLKATVEVLRAQRKHIKGNKVYQRAYRTGLRKGQEYYGVPLADEVRANMRKREWKQALRGALILLRYYPVGVALLNERRMDRYRGRRTERRELARQIQANRQELKAHKRRLKELGSAQELESALVKEHQEVQLLRWRIQRSKRRMQNLDQRAFGKLLRRLGYLRAKVLRR